MATALLIAFAAAADGREGGRESEACSDGRRERERERERESQASDGRVEDGDGADAKKMRGDEEKRGGKEREGRRRRGVV